MPKLPEPDAEKTDPVLASFTSWKLEDAKSRFSELVKLARREPPRVTIHGKDAVMVVDAETFAKLLPATQQPSLHGLLSGSPLTRLELNPEGVRSPVRDVEL